MPITCVHYSVFLLLVDFVSAPFLMDRIHLYQGYEDPSNFFRPAQRSWLVSSFVFDTPLCPFVESNITIIFHVYQLYGVSVGKSHGRSHTPGRALIAQLGYSAHHPWLGPG